MKEKFLQNLGFLPKNNASGVFYKNYKAAENYRFEVDFRQKKFNFGGKIRSESETALNFSQEENWVVFECVNRLLEKGYRPEDIVLEKTWQVGHGASGGRLDILVNKNKRAYLMIECKTWGAEFEKALKKLQKDGGQLFTYFQQDDKADYLMLYTSNVDGGKIEYKNEIIKIESHCRKAGNVKDFYERWNKISKQNGIFDDWVGAYQFQNRTLTKKDLKPLEQADSVSLFNKFEIILRKHTVSDGPNAFNKIFNLFLAKIFDEKKRETDELDFQWKEGVDNEVDFQVRLINLHKEGMMEFLRKEVEGIKDSDFSYATAEELREKKKKILKFNKIFDIKEVFDDESFEENFRVLKEVVELLSEYQVRYPRKQQHLSDFFERLLTTGLKQKAGQFFTPPPVARFIIKSLPIKEIVVRKLSKEIPKLPAMIDYAAGSGHFLTETMEEIQKIIDGLETKDFYPDTAKKVKIWQEDKFDWASSYVYGIEKDYRLVKVAKVGCYFYGDGLAQVVYGDGLDSFCDSKNYRGLIKSSKREKDNPNFDLVISNPPYSVQKFRTDIRNKNPEESFELYESLTDNSREIECLFVERTKQLLAEGGAAGVILPSSILTNTGIYSKTREILLKYFEIVGISEMGSGTFMATGTNTAILFLRRRSNEEWKSVQDSVERFFSVFQDFTAGGTQNVFSRYASRVWEVASFSDFVSLCQGRPNEKMKRHEIFREYEKKIKSRNEEEKIRKILEIEKEKLLYFILTCRQKTVVVKSGKKKDEKAFLGYEFSNRRGYEGIHPVQRSRTIDECTMMYDPENQENSEKANSYIQKAFRGDFDWEISEPMKKYVSLANLSDMLIFDRSDFEKIISLSAKKNSKIDSKWEIVRLGDVADIDSGDSAPQGNEYFENGEYPLIRAANLNFVDSNFKIIPNKGNFINKKGIDRHKLRIFKKGSILFPKSGQSVNTNNIGILPTDCYIVNHLASLYIDNPVIKKYVFEYLKNYGTSNLKNANSDYPSINLSDISDFKIPLPPKEIQEKIVGELEKLEEKEGRISAKVSELNKLSKKLFEIKAPLISVENLLDPLESKIVKIKKAQCLDSGKYPVISQEKDFIIGYANEKNPIKDLPVVIFGDHNCFFKYVDKPFFQGADGIKILKPNSSKILPKYFYYSLLDLEIENSEKYMRHYGYLKVKKIAVPRMAEQQKIVSQIGKIEEKISAAEKELEEIKIQKEEILKKYL